MLKSILFRFVAVTASLLFALLILEGAFRVLGIGGAGHEPRTDRFVDDAGRAGKVQYRSPNSTIISRYDSNPRGYFDDRNEIRHEHNSLGFRDAEHTWKKPPGTYRIVGLGDSFLWGQGVRREDICINVLARRLGEDLGPLNVEAINLAVSGLDTAAEQYMLEKIGVRYDPDLVILCFVPNDIDPSVDLYSGGFNTILERRDALSEHSFLWSWICRRYRATQTARRYVDSVVAGAAGDNERWKTTCDALDTIGRICAENRARLLVVIFPFFYRLDDDYPFQIIHDRIAGHCRDSGIDVLDLKPFYKGYGGPELWVHPIDQHPNETAHRIAADAIRDHLLTLLKNR